MSSEEGVSSLSSDFLRSFLESFCFLALGSSVSDMMD